MNELLTWLVANYGLVVAILAVILAVLYAYSKGALLDKLALAWGVIVAMAKEVLASIPEKDFEDWATVIYDVLPAWAARFTSVTAIKRTLMKWRDLMVAKQGTKGRLLLAHDKMRALMRDVGDNIEVLLT